MRVLSREAEAVLDALVVAGGELVYDAIVAPAVRHLTATLGRPPTTAEVMAEVGRRRDDRHEPAHEGGDDG